MCSHPAPPSHLPPHPIPQGHPSAPALSTQSHASNLDWRSVSHMIIYMIQCYFLKSSHPHLLPQSPKVCSLHLCLFCCLTYRVIVTCLSKFHSVQVSCSLMSNSLRHHELQHTRPPCPSPTPRVYPNSCPLSRDVIQPSHRLSSPSPSALNLSQHQGLFQ